MSVVESPIVEKISIRPQKGPQEIFLSTPADIALYGGGAGSGKSHALLMEPLRHITNPGFGCVTFRRTCPEITTERGLWHEASKMYIPIGAASRQDNMEFTFPLGGRHRFAHLEHDKTKFNWHGSQIALLQFDELTTFLETQFWYMQTRNRSTCGIRPYCRATCNPDADSWVAALIAWWIDQDTGYPIMDRSGVLRWFARIEERLEWDDSWEALHERLSYIIAAPGDYENPEKVAPQSFTFIPALLSDNAILMKTDPTYKAKLLAQPLVERERLLKGNWKIRHSAGQVFPRGSFELVDAIPAEFEKGIRYYDKAASVENNSDYTAGVLMLQKEGVFYIADVVYGRWTVGQRNKVMRETADIDWSRYGDKVVTWIEQEPGSGGKESAEFSVRDLAGYTVKTERVTGDKVTRAGPWSSQVQAGNARVLRGKHWTIPFMEQHYNFPGGEDIDKMNLDETAHDDMVDAASGSFNKLFKKKKFFLGI